MKTAVSRRLILATPYRIARLPLSVLDVTLAQRLNEDSGPRLLIERTIGSFDLIAGRLLSDPAVSRRGSDRVARADKLATAASLDHKAAQARAAAAEVANQGADKARQEAASATDRVAAAITDAERIERQGKQRAAAQARAKAVELKEQAKARQQRQETAAARRAAQADAAADRKVTAARQTAAAKRADATRTRAAAAKQREKADELAKVRTAKRQARKQS